MKAVAEVFGVSRGRHKGAEVYMGASFQFGPVPLRLLIVSFSCSCG